MSVLELLRGGVSSRGTGGTLPLHRHLLSGAATALASSLALVLPSLLVWVAAAESSVPWTDALGVGASLWLLGQGAHLTTGAAQITVAPLLLLAFAIAAGTWGAVHSLRETAESCPTGDPVRGLLARPLATALGAWALGYAGCAALWAAVGFAAGPAPVARSLPMPLVAVPVTSALVAAWRLVRRRPALAGPLLSDPGWLPQVLRRAWLPALWGAGAVLGAGLAACVLMVVLRFDQVAHLQGQLAPGLVGGAVLALGQVAALPNLAVWAVSFLAGTGFSVVEGASTTWTGSRSGLMPMVPVLGALPEPGAFPGVLPALVLLPVGAGALIGWRSLKSVARLSSVRTKASVMGVAVPLAAGVVGLLDVIGGGSLGVGRLSDVGAPAGAMTLALLLEFAVGAALVLAWDRWKLRR